MKVFIVLSVVAACAFAKPTTVVAGVPYVAPVAYSAPAVVVPAAVSSQFHAQDELGQYSYGYSSGLSSKVESKSFDGTTHGGYSYVDAEGKVQNVQYTADPVHGFRVAATNLPVAPVVPQEVKFEQPKPVVDTPEVAAAKIQHLAAVEEAKVRNAAAETEIVAPVVAKFAPVATPFVAHVEPTHYTAPVAAVKYTAPVAEVKYTTPVEHTVTHVTAPVAEVKYAAPLAEVKYAAPISEVKYAAPVAEVKYTAPVTAVKYAAPAGFSYGYTSSVPYTTYASNFVAAPVAYSAPVAYPHGYAYTVPSYYNVVPKFEEVKVKEFKA